MAVTDTQTLAAAIPGSLLSDDQFWPVEPKDLADTGLTDAYIEALALKSILITGTISGRNLSERMGLPFRLVEPILEVLRTRKLVAHVRSAAFNDYYYNLTESGQKRAGDHLAQCSYVGVAPVPLEDYVVSVEAQAGGIDPITADDLRTALRGIVYGESLLDDLGPAVNSNTGLFLYGDPGNGKTTIARRMTQCMGQEIWIPHAILDDGNLIKLKDDAFHRSAPPPETSGLLQTQKWDPRWERVIRPTVVVGGELTMDNLEVRHDPRSNICEAPLQMKSNGGCLLIDDFGRQRIAPEELLNRWIVPLENHHDFLTLPTGKKIQIPFEQLIIFSTNLDPATLVDEAFLRRVPYKIHIGDPTPDEYRAITAAVCASMGFPPTPQAAEHLIQYATRHDRPMRRCHPRDLLNQVVNFCRYRGIDPTLRPDYLDRACKSYFSDL